MWLSWKSLFVVTHAFHLLNVLRYFLTVLSAWLWRIVLGSLLARSFNSGSTNSSSSFQLPCLRNPKRQNCTHTRHRNYLVTGNPTLGTYRSYIPASSCDHNKQLGHVGHTYQHLAVTNSYNSWTYWPDIHAHCLLIVPVWTYGEVGASTNQYFIFYLSSLRMT